MGRKDEARLNSSGKHPNKLQFKDNSFRPQLQTIFHYLISNLVTDLMVLLEVQVLIRSLICGKRDLGIGGKLLEVVQKQCLLTGFNVLFLATDHENARSLTNQLTLGQ